MLKLHFLICLFLYQNFTSEFRPRGHSFHYKHLHDEADAAGRPLIPTVGSRSKSLSSMGSSYGSPHGIQALRSYGVEAHQIGILPYHNKLSAVCQTIWWVVYDDGIIERGDSVHHYGEPHSFGRWAVQCKLRIACKGQLISHRLTLFHLHDLLNWNVSWMWESY